LYLCTQQGIIPTSGSITLSFACQTLGPIAVPQSVAIYQQIPNWSSATFVSGVVGQLVESRSAFEVRRAASVAANARGFTDAVLGAVLNVSGVLGAYVIDNPQNTSQTIGGVTLAANSLYVCVFGGTSAAIAQAIWSKKSPGCSYNGSTTATVTDPNPAYGNSPPSYTVAWTTATPTAISFTVTIKNSASVPANALTLVANAISTAFLGQDNGPPATIGSEIFASRFYGGIAALGTWAQIVSVQLGTDGSPGASFTGSISSHTLTVSGVTGTIAIGQFVYGIGVATGTIITAGSGTSWTVSVSQTVSSEAMTSVNATANDVTLNINQYPTFAGGVSLPVGASPDVNLILQ
jgi:hypothetical protein